jgi:exo-1,4-beta-D-glucosaminidase
MQTNTNPKSIEITVVSATRPQSSFMTKTILLLLVLLVAQFIPFNVHCATKTISSAWSLRSSANVTAPGETISTSSFDTHGWYLTNVPSTVLAALVKNGVYRDPYYGKNLETISVEPFRVSWWYRTEFDLDSSRPQTASLIFDGINYSANIFLNGKQIASADELYGAFRHFNLDVSKVIRPKRNVLAVQVYPPKPGDYTVGFVDWNPVAPDRNMGLWREVKLHTGGPVTIEDPFVQTKLDLQSFKEARLSISAKLANHMNQAVTGKLTGQIEGGPTFTQQYSLSANEKKEVMLTADDIAQLVIKNPRVWWPNNHGSPELYKLELTVRDQQTISDSSDITFGIREVADHVNAQGHRGYIVNGKKILIRGGGWADDLLLQEDEKNLDAQFRYAKHLNLNLVRLEGFWGSSEKLYDMADRYGLLLMAGVSCQWEWKNYLGKEADEDYGGATTKEDIDLLAHYMRDQVIWLRNHPSILVWAIASDKLPHPDLEKQYRADLARLDPTRPILLSTKSWESKVSGPSAVKMNGPYEYVPPHYWYVDKENGGAFGFDTEVSPGAQPPPAESIQKMFSKEHYWPVDDAWNFHSGRNEFNNMDRYMTALNKRYGPSEDLDMFSKKSQALNYEGIRAMYEAFGIRKPVATGIVQWMLNAAWPKMFWQLYDYYLMPGGAFYAARKANQPLNIAYDYSNRSIYLVNDTHNAHPDLIAEVKVLSADSKELFTQTLKSSIGQNESKKLIEIPAIKSPINFLSLKLKDGQGSLITDNFYWLSSKQDVLDFKGSDWYYTPIKEYADFTALNELRPVSIQVEDRWSNDGVAVTLKNPNPHTAFFIELKVISDKTGQSILPVFWNDNYVSLLPGETKQLTAKFSPTDLKGEKPMLQYSGWNVPEGRSMGGRAFLPANSANKEESYGKK